MSQSQGILRILGWPAFRNHTNPYTALLYQALQSEGVAIAESSPSAIIRGGYDILHIHWPDYFFNAQSRIRTVLRAIAFLALVRFARVRGAKVIWTVHNLESHERYHPCLESFFLRWFVRQLSGFIALTNGGKEAAIERFPYLQRLPSRVVPHGHYKDAYTAELSREAARAHLRLDPKASVALFFGTIRAYKNVPHLVEVFRSVVHPNWRLIIAGNPASTELRKAIISHSRLDHRIQCHLRPIPPEEVQIFMRAADLVVLPFRDILNSGSALLALSFRVPIVVPRRGAMAELADVAGSEWVATFEGELTPDELAKAMSWAERTERTSDPTCRVPSWRCIAAETFALFQQVYSGEQQT